MCENLCSAWNDKVDIVFTGETYIINDLFRQAIDCAFNVKMNPNENVKEQPPAEMNKEEPMEWTHEQDNCLLDSYFKLQHLYRGDDLWSKITYILNRDYDVYSNDIENKERIEELLDDYDYKSFINQQVEELDSCDLEDNNGSVNSGDYFDDPYANYCDICSLNVFDCDC